MIDVKNILSEQDCSLSSFDLSSDKNSSISELDNIPYQKMVDSLGQPSESSRNDFGGLKGSGSLFPEFYLSLMLRLREVPVGDVITIEEKTWNIKEGCVLTIWYEVSGETLKPISNLYYEQGTDF